MISSNSFSNNDIKDISAHCFRATLAINKYKEGGAFFAQAALNHKKVEILLAHYIKVNERNIDLKEESKYKKDKTIASSFNFFDDKERLQEDSSSNDEEEELLFSLDYSNLLNEEKQCFWEKKKIERYVNDK